MNAKVHDYPASEAGGCCVLCFYGSVKCRRCNPPRFVVDNNKGNTPSSLSWSEVQRSLNSGDQNNRTPTKPVVASDSSNAVWCAMSTTTLRDGFGGDY